MKDNTIKTEKETEVYSDLRIEQKCKVKDLIGRNDYELYKEYFGEVSARAAYGSSGLNPWEKVDVYPEDCWAVRKAYHLYVVQNGNHLIHLPR